MIRKQSFLYRRPSNDIIRLILFPFFVFHEAVFSFSFRYNDPKPGIGYYRAVIGHILHNRSIGADPYMIPNANPAENNSACPDKHMISNNRRTGMFATV